MRGEEIAMLKQVRALSVSDYQLPEAANLESEMAASDVDEYGIVQEYASDSSSYGLLPVQEGDSSYGPLPAPEGESSKVALQVAASDSSYGALPVPAGDSLSCEALPALPDSEADSSYGALPAPEVDSSYGALPYPEVEGESYSALPALLPPSAVESPSLDRVRQVPRALAAPSSFNKKIIFFLCSYRFAEGGAPAA